MDSQRRAKRHTQEEQALLRQKAVEMVLAGNKQVQVAQLLGMGQSTVSHCVRRAKANGKKSIAQKKRGGRKPCRLTGQQSYWIRKAIEEKHPEQLKLPFALWTREAIAALIQRKYGLVIPLRTLTDYLKRWG